MNGSDSRELVSLLFSYWASGTGFCWNWVLSLCHSFLRHAKPLKSAFYNHLLHVSHFSGSPTSALGPILQKSIAVTESNETHTLKIQTIA